MLYTNVEGTKGWVLFGKLKLAKVSFRENCVRDCLCHEEAECIHTANLTEWLQEECFLRSIIRKRNKTFFFKDSNDFFANVVFFGDHSRGEEKHAYGEDQQCIED